MTVMLVPHSNGSSVSISLPYWLVSILGFLILTSVGFLLLMVLPGWSQQLVTSGEYVPADQLEKLQAERKELKRRARMTETLREKLEKTRKNHEELLQLTGFQEFSLPKNRRGGPKAQGDSPQKKQAISSELPDKSSTSANKELRSDLDEALERSRQVAKIREFLKNRNKVFRNTPTLWPTEGWISSPYGNRKDPMGGSGKQFHHGVDIAAWHGSPVRAPADGEVVTVEWQQGYGKTVEVRHEYGYRTIYGHLAESTVSTGEELQTGDLLGRVGKTGRTTGSHLHYEIRINDESINPWPYLIEQHQSYKRYK